MTAELVNRQSSSAGLFPEVGESSPLVIGRSVGSGLSLGVPLDDQTPLEREKAAFERQRPALRHLAGYFVAVHNGEVVASDRTRNGVLRKFFAEHQAGSSVYIGFVGPRPVARVSAPFFARLSPG